MARIQSIDKSEDDQRFSAHWRSDGPLLRWLVSPLVSTVSPHPNRIHSITTKKYQAISLAVIKLCESKDRYGRVFSQQSVYSSELLLRAPDLPKHGKLLRLANVPTTITRGLHEACQRLQPHPIHTPHHESFHIYHLPLSVYRKNWPGCNKWRVPTAEVRFVLL
jgi:hypothetical protein